MTTLVRRAPLALALLLSTVALGSAGLARAQADMHTLRIEGGLAIPVTNPQASRFDLGGGGAIGYELRPAPWLGIEARFSAYVMPSSAANPTPGGYGTYYAPGLGLRLHPLAGLGVGDLWLGATGAVAFTGDLIRPSLEVGLGYEFDVAWWLRMGPYVRYNHVFQTDRGGSDAGFITVGLSFAFGGTEPARDRDGDGILDAADACPDEPEDMDSFEDTDGCPELDNDRDGIPDTRDECPNVAEDMDGFEDTDGCPEADNDQDGILDGVDGCPDVAEDRDGFQDEDGCPEPDNDMDGILDGADRCPDDAETRNGFEDEDGCPDVAPPPPAPPRTQVEIQLDELGARIQFPQGRFRVLPSSRAALRSVIRLLREHPELEHVIIEAHASAEGDAAENMELSRRRAETVVAALVRGGISRDRVVARAFGEQRTEGEGTSEEELAADRRVVFIVQHSVVVPAP